MQAEPIETRFVQLLDKIPEPRRRRMEEMDDIDFAVQASVEVTIIAGHVQTDAPRAERVKEWIGRPA